MNRFFLILVSIALVLSSCDLFDPRVPEDPSNAGVVWQDPTSPDIVIENIQSALNGSSALYLDCFNESFVFYADTNDINEYTTYNFSDWTKMVESNTVTSLFAVVPQDSTIQTDFVIDPQHQDPAAPVDSATIYREYSITVPGSYHSGTGTPAVGLAEFHMIEDANGLWSILEWHDLRHEEANWATWAVAKAFYR